MASNGKSGGRKDPNDSKVAVDLQQMIHEGEESHTLSEDSNEYQPLYRSRPQEERSACCQNLRQGSPL